MTKRVILSILIIIFAVISLVGVYSFGVSNSKKIKTTSSVPIELVDIEDVNYIKSFDVSDFSGMSINTIDIPSLEFSNLVVQDSDFQISKDQLLQYPQGCCIRYQDRYGKPCRNLYCRT